MTRYKRKEWGARIAEPGPGRLDTSRVIGLALHWPAMKRPVRGVDHVAAALRGWQDFHMDTHGWSDIAYQEAVDQDGNVYSLRGLRNQSAANGNQTLNQQYGALLLILAEGEEPTQAMVATVKRRIRRHRELFPGSRRLVGHGDLKATTCPGPIVREHIKEGTFKP